MMIMVEAAVAVVTSRYYGNGQTPWPVGVCCGRATTCCHATPLSPRQASLHRRQ